MSSKKEVLHSSKVIREYALPMIKGGPVSDQFSGPTGSSRGYPKNRAPRMNPDFNPMDAGTEGLKYAVAGVRR
jgi:hypothetical protein